MAINKVFTHKYYKIFNLKKYKKHRVAVFTIFASDEMPRKIILLQTIAFKIFHSCSNTKFLCIALITITKPKLKK